MGQVLISRFPQAVIRCRSCGKREGEDGDRYIHTFDELKDMTPEEKKALEWFSLRMELEETTKTVLVPDVNSREDMIHLFVFENLLERLLRNKPICQTCYDRKRALPLPV